MSPLQPRANRVDFSFPVAFHTDMGAFAGHCLNLSESGLLATFSQPLELWDRGELLLSAPGCTCTLPARVARVQGTEAGLAFSFTTEAQRVAMRQMVTLAAAHTRLVEQPPF